MIIELRVSGYAVDTSRRVPVVYRGRDVGAVFCPDLIVNEKVVVELKAYLLETDGTTCRLVDEFSCRLAEERHAKDCSPRFVREAG
jgi:GxxExxY protein